MKNASKAVWLLKHFFRSFSTNNKKKIVQFTKYNLVVFVILYKNGNNW